MLEDEFDKTKIKVLAFYECTGAATVDKDIKQDIFKKEKEKLQKIEEEERKEEEE